MQNKSSNPQITQISAAKRDFCTSELQLLLDDWISAAVVTWTYHNINTSVHAYACVQLTFAAPYICREEGGANKLLAAEFPFNHATRHARGCKPHFFSVLHHACYCHHKAEISESSISGSTACTS